VFITGDRCEKVQKVSLVIDDDDLRDSWIPMDPLRDKNNNKMACHWTTNLGVNGSVSTALSHFSMRVDFAERRHGARTNCYQASPNDEALSAEVQAPCCLDEHFQDLLVNTKPPMPVSYLRRVPKNPKKPLLGVACTETGTFSLGTGEIGHTQFSGEHIDLQLGESNPKRKAPGLILNGVIAGDDTLVLTQNGVAYRMSVQRAKGQMGSPPTLSSNAISVDIKILSDLKFERAEFRVIK